MKFHLMPLFLVLFVGGFMTRLLNDEEMEQAHNETNDIETIDDSIARHQDAKTLKAVGEWLDKHTRYPSDILFIEHGIDQLKQGRMLKESKDAC